jgi:hypothetical protein
MGRLTVDEVYNTVLSIRNNSRRSFQDYGLAIEVSEVFRPTRLAERLVANRAVEELRSDTPFHFFAGCLILSPNPYSSVSTDPIISSFSGVRVAGQEPSLDLLAKLAQELRVTTDFLITGKESIDNFSRTITY